jgi:hypothetical protein
VACGIYGKRRSLDKVLAENPDGMRPLGRARNRWEENILQIPKIVASMFTNSRIISFSWTLLHGGEVT